MLPRFQVLYLLIPLEVFNTQDDGHGLATSLDNHDFVPVLDPSENIREMVSRLLR